MFQQRHFEAIAQMMQDNHPGALGPENRAVVQWFATVRDLSNLFARHNPNFKHDRFEVACLPGNNVRARKSRPMVGERQVWFKG